MTADGPPEPGGGGLDRLEARLRQDLHWLGYPPPGWVPARPGVTDVVIIGGGMCGLLAWFALRMAGIDNLRILDRNPRGFEGPWATYARMETLRSPKHLVGPAFGLAPLTFQAWFRARAGDDAWDRMHRIPRLTWMEYLRWYRRVLAIPVENGVALDRVEAGEDGLCLSLSGAGPDRLRCRKLVLATGREGTAAPNLPGFVQGLERRRWAHSSDSIDFAALRGRRVAVIGVGASAVENAAEALEHGAAEVRLFVRRREMPRVNKMMGIGSQGFTSGYAELDDAWRWRFMQYSFATQTPAPRGSTLRASRHANVRFHFGKEIRAVRETGAALRLEFADGTAWAADFLLLGTGFRTDAHRLAVFGPAAANILRWQEVHVPPAAEACPELGRFPYLGEDFCFREQQPGATPWLRHVHCFNYGATASLGKVSGDIPGVSDGAAWLARAIAAALYGEDVETHWQGLLAYDTPELRGDEWTASELETDGAGG